MEWQALISIANENLKFEKARGEGEKFTTYLVNKL